VEEEVKKEYDVAEEVENGYNWPIFIHFLSENINTIGNYSFKVKKPKKNEKPSPPELEIKCKNNEESEFSCKLDCIDKEDKEEYKNCYIDNLDNFEVKEKTKLIFKWCVFDCDFKYEKIKSVRSIIIRDSIFLEGFTINKGTSIGRINVERTIFLKDVDLSKTTFNRHASFFRVYFFKKALFRETKFVEDAHFDEIIFGGTADFNDSIFNGEFRCRGSKFKGRSTFERATFEGSTHFSYLKRDKEPTIFEEVKFSESVFEKDVFFQYVHFNGPIDFEYVKFNGGASFKKTEMDSKDKKTALNFKMMELNDFHLSGATIKNDISFEGSKFKGRVEACGVFFGGEVSFEGVHFDAYVSFSSDTKPKNESEGKKDSKTSDIVNERSEVSEKEKSLTTPTIFSKKANFSRMIFYRDAFFHDVFFVDGVEFNKSESHNKLSFKRSFFDKATFKELSAEDVVISGSRVVGPFILEKSMIGRFESKGVVFNGEASFKETRFNGLADFSPHSIHKDPSEDGDIKTEFKEKTIFEKAVFENDILMNLVFFRKRLDFTDAIFKGNASFKNIHALKYGYSEDKVIFENISVNNFDISNSEIRKPISFNGSSFYGWFDSKESLYFEKATFEDVHFYKDANFSRKGKSFKDSCIDRLVNFYNDVKVFSKENGGEDEISFTEASFKESRFDGWANFSKIIFSDKITFESSDFKGGADFREIRYKGNNNIKKGDISFKDATFSHNEGITRIDGDLVLDIRGMDMVKPIGFPSDILKDLTLLRIVIGPYCVKPEEFERLYCDKNKREMWQSYMKQFEVLEKNYRLAGDHKKTKLSKIWQSYCKRRGLKARGKE